jgi:hypothetical protein
MTADQQPRVLIVGAGSMGIVTGYHLGLAGAEVTFLVRPHRRAELERAQTLYCYDDGMLKEYGGYTLLADPADIVGRSYDFIVVTLDGTALQNQAGEHLVKTIGEAAGDTNVKVILGSVGLDLRPWFLRVSRLPGERVTNGVLAIIAYSPKVVQLPLHAPTDADLLAQADLAYAHRDEFGFGVDDSAPNAAREFAKLYDACGISTCFIKPSTQFSADIAPMFAIFAGMELMGWPALTRVCENAELWSLTVNAVKEIQGLGIHGEAGQKTQAQTTEDGLAASLAALEKDMLPLELQGFNRYHHGGKVSVQDLQILRDCIASGQAEGKDMGAVRAMVDRIEALRDRPLG